MIIFMESLQNGVARTKVFRVQPSTFEEALYIAVNVEHNFKAAHYGTNGYQPSTSHKAEAMDQLC